MLAAAVGVCSASAQDHETSPIHVLNTEQILGVYWNHLIAALTSGSDRAVRAECTRAGFQALLSRLDPQRPRAKQWRERGKEWSSLGAIRWQSITSMVAYGRLGPKEKEQVVMLVLTPQGWMLDNWSPAEN
jgi:hypothetical protein